MSTRPRSPAPSTPAPGKLTLPELAEMKRRHDRIVMVTAYDAPGARLADEAGVELILVGDTAAMVMLGHDSTMPVTLEEMIFLTRAVTRAARRPLVIGDLPFGSYETSDEQAVSSAVRMLKEGGADLVKLEGAGRMTSRLRAIAGSGIGVMGHIGLTPQSATKLGGFRAQGRTAEAALALYEDALAIEEAGCFAVVLEAVPAPVAARIAGALSIPTIGIGAGAACDGQVLVWHDLLGMYPGSTPRFVKRYAEIAVEIGGALATYASEVREGSFPDEQHTYSIPEDQLAAFDAALDARGSRAGRR
jgi:3-methyl-2-oxobutanoate hydroxymethyltransferase